MSAERMYTTRQAMRLLNVKSRQTLYSWGATDRAIRVLPGASQLVWPETLIRELADEHGIDVDWGRA